MEQKIRKVELTWDKNYHMEFIAGRIVGAMQFGCDEGRGWKGPFPIHTVRDNDGHTIKQTFSCKAADDEWTKLKSFLSNGILGKLTRIVEE